MSLTSNPPGAHRLDDALDYLQRIHDIVRKIAAANPAPNPLALCRQVLAELGIPAGAANPLVVRSFASHLQARDTSDLRPVYHSKSSALRIARAITM